MREYPYALSTRACRLLRQLADGARPDGLYSAMSRLFAALARHPLCRYRRSVDANWRVVVAKHRRGFSALPDKATALEGDIGYWSDRWNFWRMKKARAGCEILRAELDRCLSPKCEAGYETCRNCAARMRR